MNNKEFSKELAEYILKFITENNLEIVDTKKDIINYYEENLDYYKTEYPYAPDELTLEESIVILNIFKDINKDKLYWETIHDSIIIWLRKRLVKKYFLKRNEKEKKENKI